MSDRELEDLRQTAQWLDHLLNGEHANADREGFILLRFRHGTLGKPQPLNPQYIATCPNEVTLRILKLMLAQLEGRITGEEGNA